MAVFKLRSKALKWYGIGLVAFQLVECRTYLSDTESIPACIGNIMTEADCEEVTICLRSFGLGRGVAFDF
jgi:hypothetical protein